MTDISKNTQFFSRNLLRWNREKNFRQMPWKNEKDPYKIWLSEIILQQTRVEQGLSYYNKFVKTFPDVHKLAKAPGDSILKLWEGLGYYSRCRNLVITAKYISKELNGEFPDTYEKIKALKGIGPYTAAAISSFAFNLPHAVLDGNVFRVLARIFGIYTPSDSSEGKKQFTALSNELLDKKQPGVYNQAIMDFGAMICKPVPLCNQCVFRNRCFAFLNNKINELPVKEKKMQVRRRWFYYLVVQYDNKTAIRQRTGKDIWQQLYEYPLIEATKEQDAQATLSQAEKKGILKNRSYETISISPVHKQQLSHQLIIGQFIEIKLKKPPGSMTKASLANWLWLTSNELKKYPFPGFINQYLAERSSQALF
jgi:A/G-specific adenine glycosylase